MKYHGVDPQNVPLYLKELEFRYNNHDQDIYDMLIQNLNEYHTMEHIE